MLFVSMVACALLLGWASRVSDSVALELWALGFESVVILGYTYAHWSMLAPTFRIAAPSAKGLALDGAVALLAAYAVHTFLNLLDWSGVPFIRLVDRYVEAGWSTMAIYLVIAVWPAIFEELAFRGLIQGWMEKVVSRREALIVQATLFAVLHFSIVILPSHFALGMVFGWLRSRSGRLYPAMLMHGMWNTLIVWQELHGPR